MRATVEPDDRFVTLRLGVRWVNVSPVRFVPPTDIRMPDEGTVLVGPGHTLLPPGLAPGSPLQALLATVSVIRPRGASRP